MGSGWEYGLCLYGRVNGEPCVLRGDRTRGVGRPLWGYWAGSPVNVCWGLGELIRVCRVLGGGPGLGGRGGGRGARVVEGGKRLILRNSAARSAARNYHVYA